jgi:hypothetical protein
MGRALLLRIQPKRFELPTPFRWSIAQPHRRISGGFPYSQIASESSRGRSLLPTGPFFNVSVLAVRSPRSFISRSSSPALISARSLISVA